MQIELKGFEQLHRAFHQAPQLVAREMDAWMIGQGLHMQGEVQERTPTRDSNLRNSIASYVVPAGRLGVEAIITTSINYATPVELGRKKIPLQNFNIDGKIVRSKGAFMFKKAFEANSEKVQASFSEFVEHILGMIAAGAR